MGEHGEMWQELGIAPTSDVREIRRAYAKRLRLIDADRDIAAFQRLRRAFEAALAQIGTPPQREGAPPPLAGAAPDVDVPPGTPSRPGAVPESEAEAGAPFDAADAPSEDIELTTIRARVHQALREGDVEIAFAALKEALSAGFLPPVDAPEIVRVMAAAVDDRSLPGDRFRMMAEQLGWSRPAFGIGDAQLREKVVARYDAEVWLDGLRQAASGARSVSWADHHRRWLAHLLLGGVSGWRLYFVFTGYLRDQLEAYDRFAPWLHDRVDQRQLAWLRSKLLSRWSRFWLVAAHGGLHDVPISLAAFAFDLF
jgi:hypothetical protein